MRDVAALTAQSASPPPSPLYGESWGSVIPGPLLLHFLFLTPVSIPLDKMSTWEPATCPLTSCLGAISIHDLTLCGIMLPVTGTY